jgi:hypothetical protein
MHASRLEGAPTSAPPGLSPVESLHPGYPGKPQRSFSSITQKAASGARAYLAVEDSLMRYNNAKMETLSTDADAYFAQSSHPLIDNEAIYRGLLDRSCLTFRFCDTTRYFPYMDTSNNPTSLHGILLRPDDESRFEMVMFYDAEAAKRVLASVEPGRNLCKLDGVPSGLVHAMKEDTRSSHWRWDEAGPVLYMRTIHRSRQCEDLYHYVHMRMERTGFRGSISKATKTTFTIELVRIIKIRGHHITAEVVWSIEVRCDAQSAPILEYDSMGCAYLP